MRRPWLFIPLLMVSALLAACGAGQPFEDAAKRETREAGERRSRETAEAFGTQASTMVAMQATVDYAVIMATQVGQLNAQNQALQGTLTAMGGGQVAMNTVPQAVMPTPTPNLAIVTANPNVVPQVSVNTTPGAIPTTAQSFMAPGGTPGQLPQVNQVQPGGGVPQPQGVTGSAADLASINAGSGGNSTSSLGIGYSNATTATSVDDNTGCALTPATSFALDQPEIYMVITGTNIQPGVRYNVNWLYNGTLSFDSGGWTSDAEYASLCIWFSALGPFDPGSWSAEFTENGVVVADVGFTVTGERLE